MSASPAPTEGAAPPVEGEQQGADRCPVCGGQLARDQDWCLRCGAAARTRLAPPPRWRPLVSLLAIVIIAALIGLALALAKLAGASGSGGAAAGALAMPRSGRAAAVASMRPSGARTPALPTSVRLAPAAGAAGATAPGDS